MGTKWWPERHARSPDLYRRSPGLTVLPSTPIFGRGLSFSSPNDRVGLVEHWRGQRLATELMPGIARNRPVLAGPVTQKPSPAVHRMSYLTSTMTRVVKTVESFSSWPTTSIDNPPRKSGSSDGSKYKTKVLVSVGPILIGTCCTLRQGQLVATRATVTGSVPELARTSSNCVCCPAFKVPSVTGSGLIVSGKRRPEERAKFAGSNVGSGFDEPSRARQAATTPTAAGKAIKMKKLLRREASLGATTAGTP
jgi:hypothetical protein